MSVTSRLQDTANYLERLARELGAGEQLPTVRELRQTLGISNVTINSALDILEERGVVERRRGSGIYVNSTVHRRRIGLLLDPTRLLDAGGSPFWSLLVRAIEEQAALSETDLAIYLTAASLSSSRGQSEAPLFPDPLDRVLRERRLQGVLAVNLSHAQSREIEARGIPVVAFAGPADYMVAISHSEMIQIGVAELVRCGCRRLALCLPELPEGFHRETFTAALVASGLPRDSGQVLWPDPPAPRYFTRRGYDLGRRLLASGVRSDGLPDGLLSTDDMLTQGLLMALTEAGVSPGEALQVYTHSNAHSPVLLAWQSRLIRLEFDLSQIARILFDTLLTRVNGDTLDTSSWETIVTDMGDYYHAREYLFHFPGTLRFPQAPSVSE